MRRRLSVAVASFGYAVRLHVATGSMEARRSSGSEGEM